MFEAPSADIVTIDLTRHPPNHPLGMLLAPGASSGRGGGGGGGPSSHYGGDTTTFGNYFSSSSQHHALSSSPTASNVTLVAGWEHGNGGLHLGPIQRSGLVRLGDRLVRINGRDVTDWTFREVMDALKELVRASPDGAASGTTDRHAAVVSNTASTSQGSKRRLKTLGFAPYGTPEWSRGTHINETVASESMFFGLFHQQPSNDVPSAHVVHSKRRYSFVSFVGRWKVAYESLPGDSNVTQQKAQLRQLSYDSNGEGQFRQHSDNSNSDLERQLNKEPSIRYDNAPANDAPLTASELPSEDREREDTGEKKPYIQYEIQCHILFRDTSSFQSHIPHPNLSSSNPNNIHHHSWSVWKRYSELQTLDEELRHDFGWQMDALDDGRGVAFPSSHGLESWWYGFRSGGGVMSSLMGGASSAETAAKEEGGGGWGTGSLYSLFGTVSKDEAKTATNSTMNDANQSEKNPDSSDDNAESSNCPFPTSFLQKRQKELASYWTNLMRIEDIFEFGDMHSHKFGKTMAVFLGVDKVLLSRKNGVFSTASNGQLQHTKKAFPAINENETAELLGSFQPRPFEPSFNNAPAREVSGLTTIHDDDVSLLSDGTGAFGDISMIAADPGRPVVDILPPQHSFNGRSTEEQKFPMPSSNLPVGARPVGRRQRGTKAGSAAAAPRAKPAFQRQFAPL